MIPADKAWAFAQEAITQKNSVIKAQLTKAILDSARKGGIELFWRFENTFLVDELISLGYTVETFTPGTQKEPSFMRICWYQNDNRA